MKYSTSPSELTVLLQKYQIKPNHRLSQNFLIDQNIVDKIIHLAGVSSQDHILEIGPGLGALTSSLLEKKAHVIAIEKDPLLAKALQDILPQKNLSIFCEDFLESSYIPPHKGIKVLSNVPYNITTPIIEKLSQWLSMISSITLMVQKEMAERMLALPPNRKNCAFSILIHYFYDAKHHFDVKPSCFYPKPSIDSSVIQLIPKDSIVFEHSQNFITFVKKAFLSKRKMLRNTLKEFAIIEALQELKLPETTRPEELSAKQFALLFQTLHS